VKSKFFAPVHEAFSSAYSDKKVLNTTTVHQLITKPWDTGSVCLLRLLIEREKQLYRFQAIHQVLEWDMAAGI
jgi:hemoglobin-like flavoprotein